MPYCFIQTQKRIPFRDRPGEVDNPLGDFTDGEVHRMNLEFIEDRKLQEAGHND